MPDGAETTLTHAHLQSVFVVIILSHDGRLKGILSLLSRQHHQRSHGQGCSLQPDTRQVLSRLNVQVRLFTRNGMLRYIPILVTICTWRQRSRHCGRDSLSLQDILSGIRECPPECKQDDI
ncbi:TPA: hypothetical protein HGS96_22755 [Escherichia coli]|nr:hypothetical protein [Escherichia coli]